MGRLSLESNWHIAFASQLCIGVAGNPVGDAGWVLGEEVDAEWGSSG